MHRPGPGWRGACHKQLCSTAAARFLGQQLGPVLALGHPASQGTLISDLAPYFLFSRNIIWLSHYDIRGGRRVGAGWARSSLTELKAAAKEFFLG